MGRTKVCNNLFEADLRRERATFADEELCKVWMGRASNFQSGNHKVYPSSCLPKLSATEKTVNLVDSYRAPPMKLTLETIDEDVAPLDTIHLQRSKSVPISRSASFDRLHHHHHHHQYDQQVDQVCHGLQKLPSYRPGQCYGESVSGPMTYQREMDNWTTNPSPRRSYGFSRIRESLRRSRLREAFGRLLSKFSRPNARRPA